jgi:uncharacterized protein (TIGR03067 family)
VPSPDLLESFASLFAVCHSEEVLAMRLVLVCLLAAATVIPGFAAEPEAAKKDLASLQGKWLVESLEYNGKELKDKYKLSFLLKDKVLVVEGNGKVRKEYAKLALTVDATTMPKCVDLTVADGSQKDAKLEGIYELKGDELRLCVKVFGLDRPNEFKSPEGASVALLTLKRQK